MAPCGKHVQAPGVAPRCVPRMCPSPVQVQSRLLRGLQSQPPAVPSGSRRECRLVEQRQAVWSSWTLPQSRSQTRARCTLVSHAMGLPMCVTPGVVCCACGMRAGHQQCLHLGHSCLECQHHPGQRGARGNRCLGSEQWLDKGTGNLHLQQTPVDTACPLGPVRRGIIIDTVHSMVCLCAGPVAPAEGPAEPAPGSAVWVKEGVRPGGAAAATAAAPAGSSEDDVGLQQGRDQDQQSSSKEGPDLSKILPGYEQGIPGVCAGQLGTQPGAA